MANSQFISANAGFLLPSPKNQTPPTGSGYGAWWQDTVNNPGVWFWVDAGFAVGNIAGTPNVSAPLAVVGPQPADPAAGKAVTVSATNAYTGQNLIAGQIQTPLGPTNSPTIIFRNPA
jgi:hypothetical protein